MADRNRNKNSRSGAHRGSGMSGASSDRDEGMRGSSRNEGGMSRSGSDRSSSNIGRKRHSHSSTSGSREESMQGSGDNSMRGSSSGTRSLGNEPDRTSNRSPGGVEGVNDESSPLPDEDRSRNR